MGNNNQKIQIGLKTHDKLGLIKILEDQKTHDGKTIIQIKKSILNEDAYKKWVKQFQLIQFQQSKELIYLPLAHKYESSGLCGLSGTVTIKYQYFPYLLKAQIQNRRKLDQFFSDQQIWYLLYNLIETQNILQKNGMLIGDVHPSNILLNQQGQTRCICQCSLPGNKKSFQKIVQSILADVYLAPEQMNFESIQKGRYMININENKAQMFSIGMTILQAATLEDCSFLYARNPLRINKQKLQKYLYILSVKYQSFLVKTIKQILQFDVEKRKSCRQIYSMLSPYQSQILQLCPFNYSNSFKPSGFFNQGKKNDSQIYYKN